VSLFDRGTKFVFELASWTRGEPIREDRARRRAGAILVIAVLVVGVLIELLAIAMGIPGYAWPIEIGIIVGAISLYRTLTTD
jgi:hypothetical protein